MLLKNIKYITWLYLLILVLGFVLPINNGTMVNNNYVVEVRADYLLHTMVLLPLPVLLTLRFRNSTSVWVKVILYGLLMVIFCEGLQLLIPYRTFNINDLFANGVGVLIGLIPAFFLWHHFLIKSFRDDSNKLKPY
jgi:glycopeptide antibiotics resistance protein